MSKLLKTTEPILLKKPQGTLVWSKQFGHGKTVNTADNMHTLVIMESVDNPHSQTLCDIWGFNANSKNKKDPNYNFSLAEEKR